MGAADLPPVSWVQIIGVSLAVAAIYYGVALPLFNVFLHPLRKYPGPRLWAASSLPWMRMFLSGKSHSVLAGLHDTYGPIVRVGPDELSYTAPEAWHDIMGGGRRHQPGQKHVENPKAPWYAPPDEHSILSAPRAQHARLRRVLAKGFSTAAMHEQKVLIEGHVDLLVRRLRDKTATGREGDGAAPVVDMAAWYNYCTFDIIGDLSFGEPFGCLEGSAMHPWISLILANIRIIAVSSALRRIGPLLSRLLPLLVPRSVRRKFEEHVRVTHEKVSKRLQNTNPRPDFVESIISDKSGLALPREGLDKNAMILTMAGSETTATTLAGATYRLGTMPDIQNQLARELRSSYKTDAEIDLLSVSKLRYLGAFVDECLRTYPPGPNALPRITPSGGSTIMGEHVPGNTVLGIPQRAMYLSENNFRRAAEFIPERWLGDDKEFAADRRDAFNPFSVGPRNCIGMNLAYAELRLILARMVWNFDMEVAQESRSWMEEQESYFLWTKGPLYIHLRPRASVADH